MSTKLRGAPIFHDPPIPKIQELALSNKRFICAHGGRGSGKSYGVADILIHRAIAEPRVRILCVKDTQNSLADSSLAMLKQVIYDRGYDKMFKFTKTGLATIWGAEFIFKGLQFPNRIRSMTNVKYCWVEEAQLVNQEGWDVLYPTIRADRSQFFLTWNPDLITDPVSATFQETQHPGAEVREINWQDNRYFPDVLKEQMEWDYARDPERAEWIWGGKYRVMSKALVFSGKFVIKTFDTPKDANFYLGADWGFSNDPSTLIRSFIKDRTLYIDYEAWGLNIEVDHHPELWMSVPDAMRWDIVADSARPEMISYMRKRNWRVRPSKKGAGSVEDGIEFMKNFDQIVVHPRCKHTVDEFKSYKYKIDSKSGEVTPRLEDKNNHCMDAIRYSLERVRKKAAQNKLTSRI